MQCSKQMWKSVDVKVLRCEDVKVFRAFSGIYALSVSTLTPQHLNILTSEAPSHLILASKINDSKITENRTLHTCFHQI